MENKEDKENNYFAELYSVNVSDKTEKKNDLTYLSWSWAWGELKKLHPTATYTIYENKDGLNYHTDGRTAWVKTGVTVNGIEHIEYLPVMDFKNQSVPLDKITSVQVNKTIQRSLTKAVARHGLGLYIYAGEDLPEDEKEAKQTEGVAGQAQTGDVPGYPPRAEMLKAIEQKYPKGSKNEAALLSFFRVESIEKATDAQIIAAYNKATKTA